MSEVCDSYITKLNYRVLTTRRTSDIWEFIVLFFTLRNGFIKTTEAWRVFWTRGTLWLYCKMQCLCVNLPLITSVCLSCMCQWEKRQDGMNSMCACNLFIYVYLNCLSACVSGCIHTSEVQIIGGVNDNPHQGEVESSHLGSDLRFYTAMIKIMGT